MMSKLLKWLRPTKSSSPDVEQAKELARRIHHKAEKLQKQLDHYRNAKEPAVALFADVYNARQVSRIHYGLNGKHHI